MARFVLINTIGNARAGAIFDDLQGDTQIIAGLTALGGVLMPLPNAQLELAAAQATTAYAAGGGDAIANGIMQAALSLAVGGGGGGSGVPKANAYYDSLGLPTSVPDFLVIPVGVFGRPEVRDFRQNIPLGRGAIYKNGSWSQDGDAQNVMGEGYVTYGVTPTGLGPSSTDGGMGYFTPNSFGCYTVISGVNGNNTFATCAFGDGGPWDPFGVNGFELRDNTAVLKVRLDRATGRGTFTEVQTGGAAGARFLSGAGAPNGIVTGAVGDLYTDTTGGAGTTLYAKESSPTPTTGWVPK